jgi:hypothetical protein
MIVSADCLERHLDPHDLTPCAADRSARVRRAHVANDALVKPYRGKRRDDEMIGLLVATHVTAYNSHSAARRIEATRPSK